MDSKLLLWYTYLEYMDLWQDNRNEVVYVVDNLHIPIVSGYPNIHLKGQIHNNLYSVSYFLMIVDAHDNFRLHV